MTELDFLVDIDAAYRTRFRARITALPPGGVVLDRTLFYPTGGGQPADRGHLTAADGAASEVVDVTKSGPAVVHRLRPSARPATPWTVGAELEGRIDWPRRHRHMRLHTGQHLLSARIFERTGLKTRKANLSGVGATLDLNGALDPAVVDRLLEDLADAVAHPRRVAVRHVPRAEWDRNPTAERSGLVPLPPHVDPVRVIEVDGMDVCPCGGTHLRSTGELGAVRIAPLTPREGGDSRVSFTLVDPGPTTPPE